MGKQEKLIKIIIKHVQSKPKLNKSFDNSNSLQKYSLTQYLVDILYVLKTGIAWRDLRSKINWNSVYKVFCKLVKYKLIEECYQTMLNKYLVKQQQTKLEIILTDTTFIPNKNGEELIGQNYYYNRKKGTKVSLITDAKGITLDAKCYKGNRYDSKILEDHIDTIKKTNPIKGSRTKKYKRHFLADAGYDSKKLKEKLKKLGFTPVIAKNKRNSKKKVVKVDKTYRKLYKKRLKVENTIKRIKENRRMINRYERKIENFKGFLFLTLTKLMC